jgi:hypothetical protein
MERGQGPEAHEALSFASVGRGSLRPEPDPSPVLTLLRHIVAVLALAPGASSLMRGLLIGAADR